ncbi:MAG: NADH-quinone oxidoreductase subunit J [Chloroflexi bacterium]|nr:NADH-quinone oxidoreductase subunit J [Chloroflexota bacterium]
MEIGLAIGFWVLAIVTVVSALAVVLLRDVFHAALFLVVSFVTVAGIYVTLNADFLAAVQILIYAGAIAILLLFAIMLTREVRQGSPSNRLQLPALIIAVLMLVTFISVFTSTQWKISAQAPPEASTGPLALTLFNNFALPFEVASVLLLAAIVGAIALVRER